jgi:hypothetical protein
MNRKGNEHSVVFAYFWRELGFGANVCYKELPVTTADCIGIRQPQTKYYKL